ncbi:MAG: MobC family plasmid mobilization relaxosome protein [Rikenellaceae bacterium]|nr:MobC family plasmid mobilization relaxosome protein [Rikenellaceae bacterium]
MDGKQNSANQRGRPAKSANKVTRSINLKLTESDFQLIRERAESLGLRATQYARLMTLNGKIKSRYTKEELHLRRQLTGMANNLNQIAKKANAAGYEKF